MDKIVAKIVALGVPGLVLLAVMSLSGYAGAVALTTGLAMLGGPLGMLGGIAVLGLLVVISHALAEYGFDKLFPAVIEGLLKKGVSREEMESNIRKYPLGDDLRNKLLKLVDDYFKR